MAGGALDATFGCAVFAGWPFADADFGAGWDFELGDFGGGAVAGGAFGCATGGCAAFGTGRPGTGDDAARAPREACARSASASRRSAAPASASRAPLPLASIRYPRPGRPAMARCTASRARLAVDFTVPRLIPVASAISASDMPP